MMKMWKMGVLAGGLWSVAHVAVAACKPNEGNTAFDGVTQLQIANLTVGRELPLGAVIYRQRLTVTPLVNSVGCTFDTPAYGYDFLLAVKPLPQASWSTGVYGGKVYESGVPGIGVALVGRPSNSEVIAPHSTYRSPCRNEGGCGYTIFPLYQQAEIRLIKIGNVTAGTIRGSDLPTFQAGLGLNDAASIPFLKVNFAGSINIVSRTCTTPDVNVDMGAHKVSEFSGINTGTPWKDFAIALNDCPAFHGSYPTTGPNVGSDGSAISAGDKAANAIRYRLDPNQTPINASKGVMKLDGSAEGDPAAASGVGLQVADASETPVALATLQASGITPTATNGASYSIPLKARYLQTESKVTGGPANATAVFTINYQ
nr:fimbrial protein [uncultured Pseudomonas sp.]